MAATTDIWAWQQRWEAIAENLLASDDELGRSDANRFEDAYGDAETWVKELCAAAENGDEEAETALIHIWEQTAVTIERWWEAANRTGEPIPSTYHQLRELCVHIVEKGPDRLADHAAQADVAFDLGVATALSRRELSQQARETVKADPRRALLLAKRKKATAGDIEAIYQTHRDNQAIVVAVVENPNTPSHLLGELWSRLQWADERRSRWWNDRRLDIEKHPNCPETVHLAKTFGEEWRHIIDATRNWSDEEWRLAKDLIGQWGGTFDQLVAAVEA